MQGNGADVNQLQNKVAQLEGELEQVREDSERRLQLSANHKDQTQIQLVEQLKVVGDDNETKQKRI